MTTMDEKYEDGSDHEVCLKCGMCKTCNDCFCEEGLEKKLEEWIKITNGGVVPAYMFRSNLKLFRRR